MLEIDPDNPKNQTAIAIFGLGHTCVARIHSTRPQVQVRDRRPSRCTSLPSREPARINSLSLTLRCLLGQAAIILMASIHRYHRFVLRLSGIYLLGVSTMNTTKLRIHRLIHTLGRRCSVYIVVVLPCNGWYACHTLVLQVPWNVLEPGVSMPEYGNCCFILRDVGVDL